MSEQVYTGRGLFIVLEGADLSGKSTLAKAVADILGKTGKIVLLTSEPTTTPDGELIRKHLMGDAPPTTPERFQQRFATDRGDHLDNVIRPALAEGVAVVCDRYIPSSLAYGAAEGVSPEKIWEQNRGYDTPDLVFITQIGFEETKRRAEARGQTVRLERFDKNPELLRTVRTNYWRLREDPGICKRRDDVTMLDGTLSPQELQSRTTQAIFRFLHRKPGTPLWDWVPDNVDG